MPNAGGSLKVTIDASWVLEAFKDIEKEFPKELKKAVEDASQQGTAFAKSASPVDTGRLRDSIQVDDASGDDITVTLSADARNSKGLNYGYFQEYGWTSKDGVYHEGRYYMLSGQKRAEKVLDDNLVEILRRYCNE